MATPITPPVTDTPTARTAEGVGTTATPTARTAVTPAATAVPTARGAITPSTTPVPTARTSLTPATTATPTARSAVTPSSNPTPTAVGSLSPVAALRTGGDVVSLDFCNESYNVDFDYSRASSGSYLGRNKNQFNQYDYLLKNDFVGDVENLALYSEQFDNAAWVKGRNTVSKTNKKTPLGNDVYQVTVNNESSAFVHTINQAGGTVSGVETLSFDIKSNGLDWVGVQIGNQAAYFNLKTGSFGTVASGLAVSSVYLGDGYYRVSSNTTSRATTVNQITFSLGDAGFSFEGDGVSGYFISSAQLTASAKPVPYVKTLAAAVTKAFTASPRIEYDAATGECLGYLAEGASTNLALRSEEFDNGYWSKSNAEVLSNQVISPDGSLSADKFQWFSTGTNSGQLIRNLTTVIGDIYTFSVFAKACEQRFVQIGYALSDVTGQPFVNIDLATGLTSTVPSSVINFSIVDVGNGWFRISITVEVISTSTANFLFIGRSLLDTFSASGSTVDGHGVYIWGAQIEALPFATSYIRTEGSAVTRAADVMQGGVSNTGKRTVYVEAKSIGAAGTNFLFSTDSGTTNASGILSQSTSQVRFFAVVDSNAEMSSIVTETFLTKRKAALVLNGSTGLGYVNGILVATDAAVRLPPSNKFYVGTNSSTTQSFHGHIKKATIYNIALTADEVKAL